MYNYLEEKNISSNAREAKLTIPAININLQQIDVSFLGKVAIINKKGSIIATNLRQQVHKLSTATRNILYALKKQFTNLSRHWTGSTV